MNLTNICYQYLALLINYSIIERSYWYSWITKQIETLYSYKKVGIHVLYRRYALQKQFTTWFLNHVIQWSLFVKIHTSSWN